MRIFNAQKTTNEWVFNCSRNILWFLWGENVAKLIARRFKNFLKSQVLIVLLTMYNALGQTLQNIQFQSLKFANVFSIIFVNFFRLI